MLPVVAIGEWKLRDITTSVDWIFLERHNKYFLDQSLTEGRYFPFQLYVSEINRQLSKLLADQAKLITRSRSRRAAGVFPY